jgi:hypothetical protein
MSRPATLALVAIVAMVAGCAGGSPTASPSPDPSIIPGPSLAPGTTLGPADLALLLVDRFGTRWYCDPDEFPVAHGDETTNAVARFAEVEADAATFGAIVRRLGYTVGSSFTVAQKVAIYRLWKVIVSLPLDPAGGGAYAFEYTAQPVGAAARGVRSTGTISATGVITIESQVPADEPICPICLARGTVIDTPSGPVAVEDLGQGDPIWTLDGQGRRVAGIVIAVGSTDAPAGHRVIRLVLADGRSVTASPGHPLADGRRLGTLRPGDVVDGSPVVSLDWLPYAGGRTFDLVASGPTGTYLSDGIPLGTTLR